MYATQQTPTHTSESTSRFCILSGTISVVTSAYSDPVKKFKVITTEGQVTYTCSCPYFKPVQEGDCIYGMVSYDPKSQLLTFVREPLVRLPTDSENLKLMFIRALRGHRIGEIVATALYDKIVENAEIEILVSKLPKLSTFDSTDATVSLAETSTKVRPVSSLDVINYLTKAAYNYHISKSRSYLTAITTGTQLKDVLIGDLLRWWHKNWTLRRLYLFRLNNTEIEKCYVPPDEIYPLLSNPYRLPAIPIEKCQTIMECQGLEPNQTDINCGNIVRKMFSLNDVQGWTCIPIWILQKSFPTFHAYRDTLQSEYWVTFEGNFAYLKYPYQVQSHVTKYINDLISTEVKKDDGPKFASEDYECTTLDDSQKAAIQGALTNDICIITGQPGSGKCLDPSTPILSAYGGLILAKDVKVGDLLIGDDSRCRRVLSTCTGMDHMFRITPSKGRSFICNYPHVLTLRGIMPYISIRSDRISSRYTVKYSIKGHCRNTGFPTLELAQQFINTIEEDIFDIPLNEYLQQNKTFKAKTYLFHAPVNFNSQPVPFDPYMIGYWLGDGTSSCAEITTTDPEIIEYYTKALVAYGCQIKQSTYESLHYHISATGISHGKFRSNALLNTIKDLNMIENKHIPLIYKSNSREVRLKLLAGLIDSDGYVYDDGTCIEISQKSDQLADDIEYLAFSLGFMVTRIKEQKGCMHDGTMRYGMYNRMQIFGEGLENIPTILPRKKLEPRRQIKRATCYNFTVEYLGIGPYAGFTLDSNGRFLLGDFTVTHNSSSIAEIIRNLKLRNITYALTSFTGKAVSRLQEIVGTKVAATLDRMITRASSHSPFQHLIVDESSMVTTELFYRFITAFPSKYRITFVGDRDQLQPISWGMLFSELFASKRIPVFTLTNNHRLAGEADRIILQNAAALVQTGRSFLRPVEFQIGVGFSQIEGDIDVVETIVSMLSRANISKDDITVLTPYNEYLQNLNAIFQRIYLSDAKKMMDSKGKLWYVGDRIMMTVNNYDIGIMNGEDGEIIDVNNDSVTVRFRSPAPNIHKFLFASTIPEWKEDVVKELTTDMISHSFAITIHKSQGSEQKYIIIFVPHKAPVVSQGFPGKADTGSKFLNVNLLYTAITRTKNALWLVGSSATIAQATCRQQVKRCDTLGAKLKALGPIIPDTTDTPAEEPEFIPDENEDCVGLSAEYFNFE